jgi:hypothetical protein
VFLDAANGRIRGKAAIKGVWNFTLTAQDSQNPSFTASKNFTITVKLFAGI